MSVLAPIPSGDFDPPAASHLLWRAGFGGTWDDAVRLADLGLDRAVDALVEFQPSDPPAPPDAAALPRETRSEFVARTRDLTPQERAAELNGRRRAEAEKNQALKAWWLGRMLDAAPGSQGPHPLEEKMALFWHSHFATAFEDKIEHAFPMWRQNQLFRARALGPFPELLRGVLRDPAMLVWLDNAASTRGNPNENLARELMELYTTGVGHYSEDDVREAARALTGYSVDRDTWGFVFRENAHDDGEKTFLGQTGNFDADDLARILCEHPATARFLARKLFEFFVWSSPSEDDVSPLAFICRESGYDFRKVLGVLFRSRLFYSARAKSCIVKSPVVLAIGALKCLRSPLPRAPLILGALRSMGQNLLSPPDVNGWPGGADWINSNTLLVRYNFSNFLLNGVSPDEFETFDAAAAGSSHRLRQFVASQRTDDAVDWDPRSRLEETGEIRSMHSARDIVDYFVREFLQSPAPPEMRAALVQLAETDAAGGRRSMSVRDSNFDERARGIVHLIMSSPDYQLC